MKEKIMNNLSNQENQNNNQTSSENESPSNLETGMRDNGFAEFFEKIKPMLDAQAEKLEPFRIRAEEFTADMPVERGQIRLVNCDEGYTAQHPYELVEGNSRGENRYVLILDDPNDSRIEHGTVRFMLISNQGMDSWWTDQELVINQPVNTETTFVPWATAIETDCMGTLKAEAVEGTPCVGKIGEEYITALGELNYKGYTNADKDVLYAEDIDGTVTYPLPLQGVFDPRWKIKENEGAVARSITQHAYRQLAEEGVIDW